MTRAALAFAAVFFLAPSGLAQISTTSVSLSRIDASLAEVKGAQAVFARCVDSREQSNEKEEDAAPSTATVAACSQSCSMETVLADPALKRHLATDLILRQACLALAFKTPKPCDCLADVQWNPETGQHLCRRLYLMSLFSKSLISKTGENAACEAWCQMAPTPPPPELVGKVCSALRSGDSLQACSDIEKWKSTPDHGYNRQECDWEMTSLLGEGNEEVCGRHYRPGSDVCQATALYRKAKAAGDSRLCGERPFCRAMMGEGRAACSELDAKIRDQARAFVSSTASAGGSARRDGATGAPDELECARARSIALRQLDAAKQPLKSAGGESRFSELPKEISKLEARQRNLETTYLLRNGTASSHGSAAPSSYNGGWLFFNTPKSVTGCCGSGPENLGKEKSGGSINIDATGHFLFFDRNVSIAGAVNPVTGDFNGILTDPHCGEGKITGRCTSFSQCSGNYSQASPVGPDGLTNSESGAFRLTRRPTGR